MAMTRQLDIVKFVTAMREAGEMPKEKDCVNFTQAGTKWHARFKDEHTVITMTGTISIALEWLDKRNDQGNS